MLLFRFSSHTVDEQKNPKTIASYLHAYHQTNEPFPDNLIEITAEVLRCHGGHH